MSTRSTRRFRRASAAPKFNAVVVLPIPPLWPAIAMNPRGDFVVAWTSYGSNYGDTSYGSIQGQRFRVSIFLDGFETGTTGAWSITAP